jgi:predicted dehydrogenase
VKSIIVGFGRIANSIRFDEKISSVFKYSSHAQVLNNHSGFDWIGVVDPAPEAHRAAEEWGVPWSASPDAFQEAEFAVLTIPSVLRLDVVRQLPNLKAIMIEKPLGDYAEELLDYCEDNGIQVSVNFWRRGVPYFQQLDITEEVGEPQAVFCTYGNGIKNNGSHLIDFIHMLFGEVEGAVPTRRETLGSLGCSGPQDDFAVTAVLDMGTFDLHLSPIDFNEYREVSVDIWGTNGRLQILHESLLVERYGVWEHHAMSNQLEINHRGPYAQTHVDVGYSLWNLYNSIIDGDPLCTGDMGMDAELVIRELLD